jgi:glutamyl-tRNA reductase
MRIVCLGLNHQTAPIALRERLAVPGHRLAEHLAGLRRLAGIDEAVLLSTCNRVEFYLAGGDPAIAAASLRGHLATSLDPAGGDHGHFYLHSGPAAMRHLFGVAAGLDSMVLGETEIFGQVKKAYAAAYAAGTTGPLLNRAFQRGFAVAKRIRAHTHIQRGATSVGSVAVELAERIFGELADCQVMLLGAGEMSRLTARSLLARGARSIFVSNRSFDRAAELAAEMGGEALRFDDWPSKVAEVDIVIASTAAPHFVVGRPQVEAARRLRRGRPLFMIDIAVPRNIDPRVNELDDVYLYDIDALQDQAAEARRQREQQITACDAIITEELARELDWCRRRDSNPHSLPERGF